MHSSTDYNCDWRYEDPSHSMAKQTHFSAPTWYCTPSGRYANEGASGSMDRPYFQNLQCPRSGQIRRRNLFPSFYNCCSPDRKCQKSFQDSNCGLTDSRNRNAIIHRNATSKNYDKVPRFSKQTTPVRRRLQYCSPDLWPAEKLRNSCRDDINPINPYANDSEKNVSHNSYSKSQEVPINMVDSELSKTQIRSDSYLNLTTDHRNNPPRANLVCTTKSQTNACTQNNSGIESLRNNSQHPQLDLLESIMRDTIWTSETEKSETINEELEYLQTSEIPCMENHKTLSKMGFAKCNSSEILERQIQNAQQEDTDKIRNLNENSNQNCSVIITEMPQKTHRQTHFLYANESETNFLYVNESDLYSNEYLNLNECGKIKIGTSSDGIASDDNKFSVSNDQIINQKDDDSNSEEAQPTLVEIANAFESENAFPEYFLSEDKNSEFPSVKLKKLQDISSSENNNTSISTRCSKFEKLENNMTNELDTSDNFSVNEIVEKVSFHSSDMLEYSALENNDFCTNSVFFTNQIECTLSSDTNYCLDEPDKMSILSLIDNEDLDELLSSCVAPDSVLKQKEKVKKRPKTKGVFNVAKKKRRQKRNSVSSTIKSSDSSPSEMKKNNLSRDLKTYSEGQHADFNSHHDSQTEITEKDNWVESEICTHIDKKADANQWKDSLVDSLEHRYFEKDKGKEEKLLSNYPLNEELHQVETQYRTAVSSNISLQCDGFHLKTNMIDVEEKSPIETNIPLRDNPDFDFTASVKSMLKSTKIDAESDPNSMSESIPRNSNLTESEGVKQASAIYFDCPQSLQFPEDLTVGNKCNTDPLDLILNQSTNKCCQIIEQNPDECDNTQLKPNIRERVVSDVLNSKDSLPSFQSEEEQNITKTSNIYQVSLSKMETIHFEVDSEKSMDDSVKEVSVNDSQTCRKQADTPNTEILEKPVSKSYLIRRKKPNVFEAIRGAITRISAQPSCDSSRSSGKNEILEKSNYSNVTSIRRNLKLSNEHTETSSDIEENYEVSKSNENTKVTQLAIEEASLQTSQVPRKRKMENSKNPLSKQLKS